MKTFMVACCTASSLENQKAGVLTFSGPLFSDISFQLKKKSELKVLLIKLKNENARMSRTSLTSTILFCPFQFNMKIISRN